MAVTRTTPGARARDSQPGRTPPRATARQLPRLRTEHTSARAAGQIYIPAVNWTLLLMVVLLVLGFGESTRLAAA